MPILRFDSSWSGNHLCLHFIEISVQISSEHCEKAHLLMIDLRFIFFIWNIILKIIVKARTEANAYKLKGLHE